MLQNQTANVKFKPTPGTISEILKPRCRSVIPENIPDYLKRINRWCVWHYRYEGDPPTGKWKKPPFSPRSGYPIHRGKPLEEHLGTFEQAMAACQNGLTVQGEHRVFDGIGIYPGPGVVGIDADKCVDGQDRISVPWIQRWVDGTKSYVELSPTITGGGFIGGIRCFALGRKPIKPSQVTRKGISLEMYHNDQIKYLTVTGHPLNHMPVVEDQDAINAFSNLMEPQNMEQQERKQNSPPVNVSPQDKTDDEILSTMFRTAPKGEQLRSLYHNGTMGGDHSVEDFELMEGIAYYTGDRARTAQMFKASAMYRKNGKSKNYVDHTVEKVFEKKTKFFDWNQNADFQSSTKNGVPSVPGVPEFFIDNRGVFLQRYSKKGKPLEPEWLCSPLKILAQTRSELQDCWGLLLEWKDPDGHQHTWAAPKRELVGDGLGFFRELTDRGLIIAPGQKTRNRLTEYLLSSPVDRRVTCTEKTGWHNGGVYVLPDKTIGGTPDHEVIFQSEDSAGNPYETAGTLAEWREHVSSLCRGNSRLILAISTALASTLLKITGDENGGVHIVGASSTGKTTAGTVAGSVFGGASMKQTWNATLNGLGATAITFNDAVMILDELSQCEPRAAGETAYLLSNGVEKGRANRNGSMKARRRWRMMFLSNGEIDLAQHLRSDGKKVKAGQGVRLLTIPADAGACLGLFEDLHGHPNGAAFADTLKANSLEHYGTAGPTFIEKIAGRQNEVAGQITELRKQFLNEHMPSGAESQVGRAAARFALIAIAGELATAYGITGWERGEALEAAVRCFEGWQELRGGVGNHEEQAFLEHIREHFERYGESRYARIQEGKVRDDGRAIPDRAGFREETASDVDGTPGAYNYYVLPKVFSADICSGFDRRQAIAILERRGILEIGSDGKKSISKRLPGIGRTRCYHILGERLFDES